LLKKSRQAYMANRKDKRKYYKTPTLCDYFLWEKTRARMVKVHRA
jgi:hypothetical protein